MILSKNKIFKFAIKLLVSLVFLSWLIARTNWKEVLFYMQKISVLQIVLYLTFVITGIIISSWKWKVLLRHKDIKVSLKECFQLYLTGSFINNFMPSTIGGDTYRAYQVGKKNQRFHASSSSVVFDRLIGLASLMILIAILSIFQWSEITKHRELQLTVALVLLAALVFIVLAILAKFRFWKNIASKFPDIIQKFSRELVEYGDKKVFTKSLLLSMLFALIGVALANSILFWGLGIKVGVVSYLLVIFLVSIISAIPVSINNIGIKEWAYVTFFGFYGVSASAVVAVALISRFLQMILSFASIRFYLKNKQKQ